MKAVNLTKRSNWQERCESIDFNFHSIEGIHDESPYWSEGRAYEFSMAEIDKIEDSTKELHDMCIDTATAIIKSGDFPEQFGFDDEAKQVIEESFLLHSDSSLYGRMDLSYHNNGTIKLLEYNADTPTTIIETAAAQWQWMEDCVALGYLPRGVDQYNSLEDELVKRLSEFKLKHDIIHLAYPYDSPVEDIESVNYLAHCATLAGLHPIVMDIEDIGYDYSRQKFVDDGYSYLSEEPQSEMCTDINLLYKLYPIEYMKGTELFTKLNEIHMLEPAWKGLIVSNKCILVELWKRFPNHPLLLEAHYAKIESARKAGFVRKATLSREGANVYMPNCEPIIFDDWYDASGYIDQALCELPLIDGNYPLIGSWIVNGTACGLDIRDDKSLITGNDSHFVPHYIKD